MLTPQDIIKKAERKYTQVLRDYLTGDDNFPITFPVGKLPNNLITRRDAIDALRTKAQHYTIESQTVNRRELGQQTEPRRVVIETLDSYLALIRKRTEFDAFVSDVAKIRQRLPQLDEWLSANVRMVIEYHGAWDDILTVCHYFIHNPRPNAYIRELPIEVHTKFIENHRSVLRSLLDELLPLEHIRADASDFNARFGLKDKPQLARVRLLDEQLDWQYGIRADDLTLPIAQLNHLLTEHIKPKRVVIVENLINFLTLPRFADTVGLFGSGVAVHLLADVVWLSQCQVFYWGDMDGHGFEILSDLRGLFPHVQSVMMDADTMQQFEPYVVEGASTRTARFTHLTDAERVLADHVNTHNLRLEQEHIPQAFAVVQLRQVLF